MGGRSGRAVAMMRQHGFTNARNLTGGVLAWINEIDPIAAEVLTILHPQSLILNPLDP